MAPFPLSSSVGFALMGQHQGWVVPMSQAGPGDIVIMGRGGNPLDGYGPNGHTAIVLSANGGTVTTMESWGHHGPGFHDRARSFWNMAVRIPGITGARVGLMRALTDRCVAAGIYYYAGPGNIDHDAIDDRADLNDYNRPSNPRGVDCSGFVWAAFDYSWSANPGGPPPMTAEQWAALIKALEELDVEHGMAVDVTINPSDPLSGYSLDRWGGIHPFGAALPVVGSGYWPGLDVARRVVVADWARGRGYVMDFDGGMHPFAPKGKAKPPALATAYWPGGKAVAIAEL